MCSPRADRLLTAAVALLGAMALTAAPVGAQEAPSTEPAAAVADPAAAGTMSVRVRTDRTRDSARLSLSWPVPVKVVEARNGDELVLRFDTPLGEVALDRVPALLPGWVDNVLYGYDSVLLMVAPTARATVRRSGDGVEVLFSQRPKAPPTPSQVVAATVDERRLEYLRAVVLMEEGRVRHARAVLRELVTLDPKDVQSIILLANAEERLGRWREAVRMLNRALALTPGEINLIRNRRNLIRGAGLGARVDYDVNAVRNADTQRISRASARVLVGENGMIDFMQEHRFMDISELTRPNGVVMPFHGLRRSGAATYVHEWPELQASHFSFYFSDQNLGAGYRHVWRRDAGTLEFGGALREPVNSFVEGVSDGGWRSRVHAGISGQITEGWLYELAAGVNGYGLDGTNQLASSATVSGSLIHVLSAIDPYIAIAYTLDAEYVINNEFREGPAAAGTVGPGPLFHPISVSSREVHGLQFSFERALSDYLRYGFAGGYSWDRRAKGAPFASLNLTYAPLDDMEMGVRASYARATSRGDADMVSAAGGYLMLRY